MMRDEIINDFIKKHGYKSYLEIGVYDGKNFAKINCEKKIGVDPDPRTQATVFKTSDQFFDENNEMFDIIFIDGLHHSNQVIRDIQNSLDCLNEGGTIVCHDCNPTTKRMQLVPRIQGEWTGDVWKAFVHFRSKPYLKMFVINTDYGVGIIQRGQQTPLVVENPTYEAFERNRKSWLNLTSVSQYDNTKPKISVCIPTFEQYGYGEKHLSILLQSLEKQIGSFEIIISDNSKDENIKNLCSNFSQLTTLNIHYINNKKIGISENTNNAIKNANTDFIKIMYMDDVLLADNALMEFRNGLDTHHWVTSYARAIDFMGKITKNHVPKWPNDIFRDKNTMGMPSMLAVRRNGIEFDNKLKTRLDCDYMYQLHKAYGPVKIIPKYLIGQRYWEKSTSRVQGNFTDAEYEYLQRKHNLI